MRLRGMMRRWRLFLVVALVAVGVGLLAMRGLGDGGGEPNSLLRSGQEEAPLPMPLPAEGFTEAYAASERGAATAPSAVSGSGDNVAPPLPQLAQRKIILQAYLEMEVEDVLRSVQQVENIAASAGGFVAASSVFTEQPPPPPLEGEEPQVRQEESLKRTQTATVTIRVPASQYQAVFNRLRGIAAEVTAESSNTSDVTEEFADLEARLRNLEATEATYLKLLAEATSIEDILILQDRINGVRLEIERIQGRINLLNGLTDLATIDVYLRPFVPAQEEPSEDQGWAVAVAEDAWETSQAVLRALGSAAIVGGVVLAWLAVPLLAGLILWRALRPRGAGGGEA